MSSRANLKRERTIAVAFLVGVGVLLIWSFQRRGRTEGELNSGSSFVPKVSPDARGLEPRKGTVGEISPTNTFHAKVSSWLNVARNEVGVVVLPSRILAREFGHDGQTPPLSDRSDSAFVRLLNREIAEEKLSSLLRSDPDQLNGASVVRLDDGLVSTPDFELRLLRPAEHRPEVKITLIRKNTVIPTESIIEATDGCYFVVSTGIDGDLGLLVVIGKDAE